MSDFSMQAALQGDRRCIARAISALENGGVEALDVRKAIASAQGRAHVIGVTGPPGAGKSTLVSVIVKGLRLRGKTVAVLAVDPSSPFTGGAILGDRVRMGDRQSDDGVFIRSLASRGHLGGLSVAAGDVIDLFDAAGFDVVIVETVGAGQSEVEITKFADTRVVVCPPGLGDDVQAIKAGVLEIADVFVVTKGDLPDAKKTESELHAMLALRKAASPVPTVLRVAAPAEEGTDALVAWLDARNERGLRHSSGGSKSAYNLVAKCIAADNLASLLGIELVSASEGSTTLRMKVERKHINFNGRCHGGAVFALGDMALGLACNSYGQITTLVDGQLSISTAVEEGEWLLAHAFEVSRSRKIGSYQVKITRARDGEHVAMLHGTVYVLKRSVDTKLDEDLR
ncbi:methylmalonyl Co-A mutase-associated GTPase MeaB [Hydrogenophaga laconesensis]|uniref:LAO/AO transport system ATPase/phenylacetic acid degradation protein PaaD n=1 Tax=Hydrogenophaga laconesensis TaxID=1805971 RepID=A0ABU1V930_9BURK|nr:methylmalonyl Co-A mutase-associated GTPase MeaB [Hydrogenophaga laconesensis]MDR7093963.1 LAO/AO transport system ATPase/phenylacetic acid degradation protein PaaD [Hydrogenophaga laconesensis]